MELLRTVLRALFRRRLRTVLTILGVAVGIFSVSLIGIISSTGSRAINDELSSLGMDGLLVSGNNLTEETLETLGEGNYPLSAAPLSLEYTDVSVHGTSVSTAVWGIDAEMESVIALKLLHGRLFNRGDIQSGAQICLVDENFAINSYQRSNIVGKSIWVCCTDGWRPFTVVGVVETGGNLLQSMVGGYLPAFLYVPYTVGALYTGSEDFGQIAVMPKSPATAKEAETWITRLLGENVSIHNLGTYKAQFNQILQRVTLILEVIAAISLLVAGLSIMTVMLVSVSERRREIGIKKSIGASCGRIACEFFTEAVMLSALGALIGNLFALAAGWYGSYLFGLHATVDSFLLLRNLLFAVVAGGLFGLLPAMRAAALSPSDALKS